METLLTAQQVRVEFGPLVAVRDISFELKGGELLGLVGPNGAGKTTLLRACAGLQPPTRGQAFVMGHPVLGGEEIVRHHIGFAPDAPPAYEELTIEQFLTFIAGAYGLAPQETRERIDFWLEQLWLTERRKSLVRELSRGMRQRLTLARTFLPQPHVILLDEPLAGIDPAGRIQLRQVLANLRDQGCAMIVSSHILSDLEEFVTHVAIIEQGSLLSWQPMGAAHEQQQTRRRYRLTVVQGSGDYWEALAGMDGIANVTRADHAYVLEYHTDDEAVAALLRDLVGSEVPVVSFAPVKESLEEAYLRAGVKQVD